MKWFFLVIVSFSMSVFGAGAGSDGGGAKIRTQFRLQAYEVIDMVTNYPEAAHVCSPDLLKTTLENSKITVVDVLIDHNTGLPVKSENLDAWSTFRRIQLKKEDWTEHFKSETRSEAVDKLILHELYRATGSCDDEDEKISVAAIQRSESKFLVTYLMKMTLFPRFSLLENGYISELLCSDGTKVGSICFYTQVIRGTSVLDNLGLAKIEAISATDQRLLRVKVTFESAEPKMISKARSIISALTSSDEVRVVLDRQSGTLSIGLLGGKMITLVE